MFAWIYLYYLNWFMNEYQWVNHHSLYLLLIDLFLLGYKGFDFKVVFANK